MKNKYNETVQEIIDYASQYMPKKLINARLWGKNSETSTLIGKLAFELVPKTKQNDIKYN